MIRRNKSLIQIIEGRGDARRWHIGFPGKANLAELLHDLEALGSLAILVARMPWIDPICDLIDIISVFECLGAMVWLAGFGWALETKHFRLGVALCAALAPRVAVSADDACLTRVFLIRRPFCVVLVSTLLWLDEIKTIFLRARRPLCLI